MAPKGPAEKEFFLEKTFMILAFEVIVQQSVIVLKLRIRVPENGVLEPRIDPSNGLKAS